MNYQSARRRLKLAVTLQEKNAVRFSKIDRYLTRLGLNLGRDRTVVARERNKTLRNLKQFCRRFEWTMLATGSAGRLDAGLWQLERAFAELLTVGAITREYHLGAICLGGQFLLTWEKVRLAADDATTEVAALLREGLVEMGKLK